MAAEFLYAPNAALASKWGEDGKFGLREDILDSALGTRSVLIRAASQPSDEDSDSPAIFDRNHHWAAAAMALAFAGAII